MDSSMCFNETEKQHVMHLLDKHENTLQQHSTEFLLMKNSFRTSVLILGVFMGCATVVCGAVYGFGAWYLGNQFQDLQNAVKRSDENALRIEYLGNSVVGLASDQVRLEAWIDDIRTRIK